MFSLAAAALVLGLASGDLGTVSIPHQELESSFEYCHYELCDTPQPSGTPSHEGCGTGSRLVCDSLCGVAGAYCACAYESEEKLFISESDVGYEKVMCGCRSGITTCSSGERNYASCQTSSDPRLVASEWGYHKVDCDTIDGCYANSHFDDEGSYCDIDCAHSESHAEQIEPHCVYYGESVAINETVGEKIADGDVDGASWCDQTCGGDRVGDYVDGVLGEDFYVCCACGENTCYNAVKPAAHSTAHTYVFKGYAKEDSNVAATIMSIVITLLLMCCCFCCCFLGVYAVFFRQKKGHIAFSMGPSVVPPIQASAANPVANPFNPYAGGVVQGGVVQGGVVQGGVVQGGVVQGGVVQGAVVQGAVVQGALAPQPYKGHTMY